MQFSVREVLRKPRAEFIDPERLQSWGVDGTLLSHWRFPSKSTHTMTNHEPEYWRMAEAQGLDAEIETNLAQLGFEPR